MRQSAALMGDLMAGKRGKLEAAQMVGQMVEQLAAALESMMAELSVDGSAE